MWMPLLALTALALVPAALGQGPTCGCPFDHYEAETCTSTADSVCAACTECRRHRYQVSPCSPTADTVCTEEVRPLTSDTECLPEDCIFPFLYRGILFNACTGFDLKSPNLWCSTVEDFDNNPGNPQENFLYCDC